MSTLRPPSRASKTAAKRRAQARKRNREIGRQIFAYVVIALLIVSTVSVVLVNTVSAPSTPATVGTPTADTSQVLKQFVDLGDQSVAAGNYISATQYYRAYLQLKGDDATVHLKQAQAML